MKTFLQSTVLAGLSLVLSASAWAAPSLVNLTANARPVSSGQASILSLTSAVTAGTPTSYHITQLPTGGTLYVNNIAVVAGSIPLALTPAQAAQLSFTPGATTGNFTFNFTATDGTGTTGATKYTIPLSKTAYGQGAGINFSQQNNAAGWTGRTVAGDGSVNITTSGYANNGSSPGAQFQVGNSGNNLPSNALYWFVDYSGPATANTSQVTFTFSRALIGFTIVVQDIDELVFNGPQYTDQVQFDGYINNTTGTPIALTAVNVVAGDANAFTGATTANTVTGTNAATNSSGNVMVTFPQAITKLRLTYRNLATATNGQREMGPQVIGIQSFGWAAEADVITTLTGPTAAVDGDAITYTVTTTNNGLDVANNVVPKLQLTNVPVLTNPPAGSTYVGGQVTFARTSTLAAGASLVSSVTFAMPETQVTGIASNLADPIDATVANNNGSLAAAQITTAFDPLPVSLTRFDARVRGSAVLLNWSTAMEKDNARFEVERSVNGSRFEQIGAVAGAGNSTGPLQYSYSDETAARAGAQVLYYRLRQVDTNGTAAYSPVRVVTLSKTAAILEGLSPNPTVGNTTLDLATLPPGSYLLTILDLTGRTVLQQELNGEQQHTLDLQPLPSGAYLVQLRGQSVLQTARLIKQD
jgi:hypothetical protein